MDAINLDILKQLQEYAQMYFDAIVEANSECGKCKFANGKYTAKDVTKWIYALPCDDIFNEDIILESGTFKCKFPYRRIFEVLSDWETMCRAGKLKTLFEIGEDEVKSAKVLTQEKTVLGAFKTKSMKLQHIGGNWWGLPKEIRKGNAITGYYELNGVMFAPGKTFWGDVASAGNQEFCKNRDDADIIKLIKSYIGQHCSENPYCEYITEVARLAGINNKPDQAATPTEMPQISTETAETVNVSAEGEKEAERAFISMCVKHHKEHAPAYSHYSLYRHNDTMFAFGKEAEITREYFQDNKYCPLSEVEREHNGEKYLCFHVSDYNGDIKGRIRDLMEQKHIAEYGTPSNGLITIWDAEEVEYWNRNVTPIEPPQSPEAPQTVECATDTPKPRETVEKRPNRTAGCAQRARRSGLGANGYSMLDYASAMLAAVNVPRKYSTELSPPGYVPPIRGDCTNCKRPTNDHITDLKPS